MMNKKTFFIILLAVVLILPNIVFGQSTGGTTMETVSGAVKSAAITLGQAIIVIGWIIAGILYLTAAGAPDKLGIAKKALVACVIGTVLVILAMAVSGSSGGIIDLIKNSFGV